MELLTPEKISALERTVMVELTEEERRILESRAALLMSVDIEKLEALLADTAPLSQPLALLNVARPDTAQKPLNREQVQAGAISVSGGYFEAPQILE